MPKDIRARIKADALAGRLEKARSSWVDAQLSFERLIPRMNMERLASEEVHPAFDQFAELNAVSPWWCRVVDALDIRLSIDVSRQIGSHFPYGLAMRFSSVFGSVSVPSSEDPYCAVLYNDATQRAFFASQLWGSSPVIAPLQCNDLVHDRMLELLHTFSRDLRRWEKKHPAVTVGFEPYPRYDSNF